MIAVVTRFAGGPLGKRLTSSHVTSFPPRHQYYLPEDYYFRDIHGFPVDLASRVTMRALARHADRYSARVLWPPGVPDRHDVPLPEDPQDRDGAVDALFDWIKSFPTDRPHLVGWILRRGDEIAANQLDGFPEELDVTEETFADLQDAWRTSGLPNDLFYPARDQRIVTELVDEEGKVFARRQFYSPRRWALRHGRRRRAVGTRGQAEALKLFTSESNRYVGALGRLLEALGGEDGQVDETVATRIAFHVRDVLALSKLVQQLGEHAESEDPD
jgi:hypothetical protein